MSVQNDANGCNKPGKSGIIDVFDSNNQGEDLQLTEHQFEIALTQMPRLSDKMREAMRRVAVDGESQKAVADSLPDVKQQHLSKNLAAFWASLAGRALSLRDGA